MPSIYEKILEAVGARVYARDEEAQALLTALVARQNAVLISSAGTAKSMLVEAILSSVRGAPSIFKAQIHPASEMDDLFGALSLSALRENRRVRCGDAYLQNAHFAFLDEIFKASGATLSALLSALNERVFFEEGKRHQIPLQCLLAASNELPTEESGALADRFTLWIPVTPLHDQMVDATDLLWVDEEDLPRIPRLSPSILSETRDLALKILKSQKREIMTGVIGLSQSVKSLGGAPLTDRGLKLACELVATSAAMRESEQVELIDYSILKFSARNCFDESPLWRSVVSAFIGLDAITQPILAGAKSTTSINKLMVIIEEIKLLPKLTYAIKQGLIGTIKSRIEFLTIKKAEKAEQARG